MPPWEPLPAFERGGGLVGVSALEVIGETKGFDVLLE